MSSIAIICASGIGDALLMQIAANHLRKLGVQTTTFSNHLMGLEEWFPGFSFSPQPTSDKIDSLFDRFDAILLQHDNTPKSKQIRALNKTVYSLYGSHLVSKHGLFRPKYDYLFNQGVCMAENIRLACRAFFPGTEAVVENGLVPPSNLQLRRNATRVVLHPTSTSPEKNWLKPRFLQLRNRLLTMGYEPLFAVSPDEAEEWNSPPFPSLAHLASFLYESGFFIGNDSGPGHLASNLGLPTLTIGSSRRHLDFWRPGWGPGLTIHPPSLVNELKLTRTSWNRFITVGQVIKQFKKLTTIK